MAAANSTRLDGARLTDAVSAAMVDLYAQFYGHDRTTATIARRPRSHDGHDRTTATTYINDNIVVCVLEDILTSGETSQIADGEGDDVIDARVAFQQGAEDEFTAAVERLTRRRVTAFMSANRTTPGIACELFFLEAPPLGEA